MVRESVLTIAGELWRVSYDVDADSLEVVSLGPDTRVEAIDKLTGRRILLRREDVKLMAAKGR